MLKAYIIEDEPEAIQLLENYISKIDFLELKGYTHNPVKAISILQSKPVDVIFLDINLPSLSGIDFVKNFNSPPRIIFTTAYPEYAVEGFTLDAVDYLLKPIPFPRFLKACQKLLKSNEHNSPEVPNNEENFSDIVYVKCGHTTYKLSWKEILYLEKDENYVIYHTATKKILSRQVLSDLEEILPPYICRIHKTFIVSLLHLSKMERESVWLGSKELPIGRTYKKAITERVKLLTNK